MLISTKTANSSAALIWTGLDATYDTLMLDIKGFVPSAGGNSLLLRVSDNNGSSWKTTGYNYGGCVIADNSASVAQTVATNASGMLLTGAQTSAAGTSLSTQVAIRNIGSSSLYKMISSFGSGAASGPHWQLHQFGGAYVGNTSVVNAIELLFGSGSIASGSASLYGLRA